MPVPALLQRIRDIVDALYKCMILTYLILVVHQPDSLIQQFNFNPSPSVH